MTGTAQTPATNRSDFAEARRFIEADISREVQLAKHNPTGQLSKSINPGGSNLLAALGLLCYTEYGGKLRFDYKKPHKPAWDDSGRNFSEFFDLLGPEYVAFRQSFPNPQDVYRSFRCGLAHEYYIKKGCTVYMVDGGHPAGIGRESSGQYFIVVETYLLDFLRALDATERHLFPNSC